MPKTLALLALLFLAACQTPSTRSGVERTPLANVPESVKQECQPVVDLPDRSIATAEAVRLWAEDRRRAGDCRARHRALAIATGALQEQGK